MNQYTGNQGVATVDSIARPTLSKVGNMTGADGMMMMMSFIVLSEQECDISVSHLYKRALRVVKRCVLSAAEPGQPKRDKETS